MADYTYRRGLEEVRELCSLRLSEAVGRRSFHEGEYYRLPNGRKKEENAVAIEVAMAKAVLCREIISQIDLHLPKAQLKAALKAAEETIENYGSLPIGENNGE